MRVREKGEGGRYLRHAHRAHGGADSHPCTHAGEHAPAEKTPQAEKTPEDNKKEDEAKEKEKEKEKPKSTADQKEEKKASAKTPHAKDYTKVDIKKASGTKVTDFETDRIDGGKLSQSYFSGGTITLVNVWSTT